MNKLRGKIIVAMIAALAFNATAQESAESTTTETATTTEQAASPAPAETAATTSVAEASDDMESDELSAEDEDALKPGEEKWVPSIEDQLNSLALPANETPANVSKEKLYSVQERYNPLSGKHELGIIGGFNMNGADYISSQQVGANYRYHFNNKHSVQLTYLQYNNELDQSGQDLLEREALLPDYDYPNSQYDVSYGYNLFYGKFRLGMDKVFYFDQYWNFGAGMIDKNSGMSPMASIEGGLAFWMGRRGSIRLGFKNQMFEETNLTGKRWNYDLLSTLSINILFGGNL